MHVTLAERKRREATRPAAAVAAIAAELCDYARARGGRFLLYGSAARGSVRPDSDVDILIDFSDAAESDAWRYAEELCWRHGMEPDVRPLRWCVERFRDRVLRASKVLA